MEKLLEHDRQFFVIGEQFKTVDRRFEMIDQTLAQHTKQLDFLAVKSVEHEDRLQRIEENMATKADIATLAVGMDELVGLARKKDQELAFLSERVRRVEQKLELEPTV